MKKLILIFSAALFAAGSFAQSIVLLSGNTVNGSATVTDPYDPLDVHAHLLNNTADSFKVSWVLASITKPATWTYTICDNYNCYSDQPIGAVYNSKFVHAGDSMDMKMTFVSHCEAGSGSMSLVMWVMNDSANTSKSLMANGSVTANCASAIDEAAVAAVSMYPSPVQEMLTVNYLADFKGAKVVVYDILGNIVAEEMVTANRLSMATTNWHTGIYFVCIEMDGAKVLTKRIQKS